MNFPLIKSLHLIEVILITLVIPVCAQFSDDFADGDFINNPVWAGNDSKFAISSGMLRLQAPAINDQAFLSTASEAIHNASWEFFVQMDFNPSSTNYSRIYLVSNVADLSQPLNGYYVMIGNTDDEISLYRQTGSTRIKIIQGVGGRVNLSSVSTKIKVTRDAAGNWELFSDVGLTGGYALEGDTVDVSHTISNYTGVQCVYTSTRSTLFWFDDFVVTGTLVPDLTPPAITAVEILDQSTLKVSFNEIVETTSAQSVSNYLIDNGIGNPASILLEPDNQSVVLTLTTPLTNGLNYSLQVSAVEDLAGNAMGPASTGFFYFVPQPVSYKDIIVNEFMADPTPVVGLPEAEFIEIYNRSINPIDLSGWKLTDGSGVATLPAYILMPTGYLVVTAAAASFPGSVGVSGFPSLNNTGDDIILRDNNGATVDSIRYNTAWYHSDEKQDGGWSLEIIDPENLCGEESNWTASINNNGGTPGAENSVNASNPDVTAPQIVSAQIKNPNAVEVVFNEKMDEGPVIATSEPAIDFSNFSYSGNLRQLNLSTSSPLMPSISYTITLSGVQDCAGNALQNPTVELVVPEAAQPGDLLVNEVLFNPKPGGVDFVEVHNTTEKYLSLKKWAFANYDGSTVTNQKTLSSAPIIPPLSYRVFTPDSAILKSQYPNTIKVNIVIATLPPMSDDQGSIALIDSLGVVMDYFQFNQNYHTVPASNREGTSLERISFSEPTNDTANWRSASELIGFATPGFKNSAAYPFITSYFLDNQNAVIINFSKPVDVVSATTTSNYTLNQDAGNPSLAELQNGNTTVRLTFPQNFTNGLSYSLTIDGIKDPDGETLALPPLSFLYFIPGPVSYKDIIISEFMVDPAPVIELPEAEFVELFNRSLNPIDLLGWKLSDGSTTATLPQFILQSASQCIVTTASGAMLFPGSIGVTGFPSLNNTADNIILKSPSGIRIDSVYYSDVWYKSTEKKDGGWTLEIIDPENLCEEEGNWTASESITGGTPGTVNSVNASNPDLTAPEVLASVITSSNIVEILFSEKMDGQAMPAVSISPSITAGSVQFDATLRKMIINVNQDFEKSKPYEISLSNIYDCSGNSLLNSVLSIILPEKALPGEVALNEILFNPKSGGVDFVEVYNGSDKYISTQKWSLANYTGDEISNPQEVKMISPALPPHSFHVFTPDAGILKSHYPRAMEIALTTTPLPSMPDDEGTIALIDSSGNVIDHFYYQDNFHNPFLKDDEGVSLERISLDTDTNNPDNWRSASQSENYATPGYKNSASSNGAITISGEVIVDPEIFSPQIPPQDYTMINYHFDQAGKVANASIYDQQGRVIKVLANNEVLSVEGFFRWDGDRDDGGRARAGYYVALIEVFDSSGNVNTFRKRVVVAYR